MMAHKRKFQRERAIVAQKFNSLIDDLLLNHADSVQHFTLFSEDSVLLQLPEDNRNFWSVALTVKTAPKRDNRFTAAENFHKEITIQRITDEYGRDLVSYRLGADNVVRRWNGGDARAERQKEQELGIAPKFATAETTPDELFEMAQRAMADLVDFQIPNQRLETQMGLQNQPIDLEEFEGLHEMLSRPDLAPRTR